jgi:hypothetical protein
VNLLVSAGNEAVLRWSDGTLEQAFEQERLRLRTYLEAVKDEVSFELGLSAGPLHG